jgi:succinyl-CoA synthetase beta subunit
VVKAQIHAGGRGKAGGVEVVKSVEDVREAQRLLGSILVTHQTGPHGKQVNRLYVEEGSAIDRSSISRRWSIAVVAHRLRGLDRRRMDRAGRPIRRKDHRSRRSATASCPIDGWWRGRLASPAVSQSRQALVTKLCAAFTAKDMSRSRSIRWS